jgi:hypothetical protein
LAGESLGVERTGFDLVELPRLVLAPSGNRLGNERMFGLMGRGTAARWVGWPRAVRDGRCWICVWGLRVVQAAVVAVAVIAGHPAMAGASGWAPEQVLSPAVPNGSLAAVSCSTASSCVAVGSLVDRTGGIVPLAEVWDGVAWSIRLPPVVDGSTSSSLAGVSCTADGDCMAVGSYDDGNFGQALAEAWNGTQWTILPVPPPSQETIALTAVACTSGTACVAVGGLLGTSGNGAVVERWNGAAWSEQSIPATADLHGVSCGSATDCIAVGDNGAPPVAPAALHWDGTSWTAQTPPDPDSTHTFTLDSVSCPEATDCIAVGGNLEDGYGPTIADLWDGTRWTTEQLPVLSGIPGTLTAVSCASATACSAVGTIYDGSNGSTTLAEAWDGTAWSVQNSTDPQLISMLSGVSCPTATTCQAVGSSAPSTAALAMPLVESVSSGDWTDTILPPTNGGTSAPLSAISCSSSIACAAVGIGASDALTVPTTASPVTELWDGQSWSESNAPLPATGIDADLYGVSCAGANACTAVGEWQGSSMPINSPQQPLAERWDGTQWTVQPIPNVASFTPYLSAVSCPSSTSCIAVGSTVNGSLSLPLVESWDGTSWTPQSAPTATGSNDESHLDGVSCTAPAACTAVGWTRDDSGFHTLAERWDGTSWTIEPTPDEPGNALTELAGVSCVAATCEAVGITDMPSGYRPIAEGYDAGVWSLQPTPPLPLPSEESELRGVSCDSSTDCVAVGYFFPGFDSMLAEHWDGVSWSPEAPLAAGGTHRDSSLDSVSCIANADCLAVGDERGLIDPPAADQYSGVPATPVNTSAPSISGQIAVNATLAAAPGGWTNTPNVYYYQWDSCDATGGACTPITGATGSQYDVTQADLGHTFRVEAWASNNGAVSQPVTSAAFTGSSTPPPGSSTNPTPPPDVSTDPMPSPSVPTNRTPPQITGLANVGATLTATPGNWTATQPLIYGYQWQACAQQCTAIAGATAPRLQLATRLAGTRIRVIVTATDATGTGSAASAQTRPVSASHLTVKQLGQVVAEQLMLADRGLRIRGLLTRRGTTLRFTIPQSGALEITVTYTPARRPSVPLAAGRHRFLAPGSAAVRLHLTQGGRQLEHSLPLRVLTTARFTSGRTTVIERRSMVLRH